MLFIKTTSGQLFRQFLKEKGLFGRRETPAENRAHPGQDSVQSQSNLLTSAGKSKTAAFYLWRYLKEIRPGKSGLIIIIIAGIAGTFLQAVIPLAGKYMIDDILPQKSVALLLAGCGVLLIAAAGHISLGTLQDYLTKRMVGTVTNGIRIKTMKHLQKLPLVRLQELKVGGILSRLQSDTEGMGALLQNGILTPFKALLMLIIGIGALFYLNLQVTFIYLFFCLLIAGCAWFFFNVMRSLQKIIREDQARISARITEVFSGIQVVRSFIREKSEILNYTTGIHLLWRKDLHTGLLNIAAHRSTWAVYWLLIIAVWMFGGYQVIKNDMSIGTLVAFLAFAEFIFDPVFMILFSFAELQTGVACTERTFDLLDEPRESCGTGHGSKMRSLDTDIKFTDVSFTYPNGTRALDKISFTIPRGETTALVGPSGAGKSTITHLLMRFYEVTAGTIALNKKDIREWDIASFRRRFGLVMQDVILFDGTIRENILYANPCASPQALEEAIRISRCDEFLDSPDRGLDSMIGENGIKLSGGQKQRVAMARAVLSKPEVLVLDEATSSLDSESEQYIQSAIKNIFKNRTSLVIAHRLSTVMDAHKIVVLNKGRVIEEGTHEALLRRKGDYAAMFEQQMEKVRQMKSYLDWE